MRNNLDYKYTIYRENKWLTEGAAISQNVATQRPKPNNEQTKCDFFCF